MKKDKAKPAGPKEKKKWNFIDYLLLLLLLISLTSIFLRILSMQEVSAEEDTATICFRSEAVFPEVSASALTESAFLIGGTCLSPVTELRRLPNAVAVTGDGKVDYLSSSLRDRVEGKLQVTGHKTENGFFLAGKLYFVPGVQVTLTGETTVLTVTVTNIVF